MGDAEAVGTGKDECGAGEYFPGKWRYVQGQSRRIWNGERDKGDMI